MAERKIIESQSKEQAQANIDKLFAPKAKNAGTEFPHFSEQGENDEKALDKRADAASGNVGTEFPHFSRQYAAPSNGDILTKLPIALLDDFEMDTHIFRPYTSEQRAALAEDISQNGVLQPPIVRPSSKTEGRYEIVAGHNRRNGALDAGYKEIDCIVRQLTDDDALAQMISTNLKQRTDLLPSEKAWAYYYQLEVLKRQGRRTDLWEDTSRQDVGKFEAAEVLGQDNGESGRQIQRYIRLTHLIKELLDMVDERKLPFIVGVTLSYLSPANQKLVHNFFFEQRSLSITQSMAETLRKMADSGSLDEQTLSAAFLSPLVVKQLKTVKVPLKKWKNRFAPEATEKQVVEICESAVDVLLDCRDEYFDKDADAQTVVDAIKEAMEAKYGKNVKKGGRKK